jgi:hypothetical protein
LLRYARNDGSRAAASTKTFALAARGARGVEKSRANQRARGMPDARCTRGLACNCYWQKRTRAYRFSGEHPTFPAQWFYGLYVVSPAIGLVCHRRQRIWLASPGWAWKTSADLTPASRRQNHTTSPYAAAPFVSALLIAHGSWLNPEPALPSRFTPDAAASTASRPASLTIRIRPSVGQDGEVYIP